MCDSLPVQFSKLLLCYFGSVSYMLHSRLDWFWDLDSDFRASAVFALGLSWYAFSFSLWDLYLVIQIISNPLLQLSLALPSSPSALKRSCPFVLRPESWSFSLGLYVSFCRGCCSSLLGPPLRQGWKREKKKKN